MNAERAEGSPWRTGVTLALVAAVCGAAVALTWQLTAERIAANRQALLERQFLPVLAGVDYTRIEIERPLILEPPHALPGDEPALVYFALREGRVTATVFEVSAAGYAGSIRLLVGVTPAARVSGVRVLEHRETPGLGDGIEVERSDWIEAFSGRSLDDPPPTAWALTREGGRFDQLTGATVTARAVVRAVKSTLLYFAGEGQTLRPATSEQREGEDDG